VTIDKAQLSTWSAAIEAELKELALQARGLEEKRQLLARRLGLVRELLDGEQITTRSEGQKVSPGFRQQVEEIVREAEGPLHLDDIRARLIRRGVEVPGRGTDANIIAHLGRISGIVRVGRGTYSFNGTGVVAAPTRRRKRRRKSRKSIKPQGGER
jgi:hypothetical protein